MTLLAREVEVSVSPRLLLLRKLSLKGSGKASTYTASSMVETYNCGEAYALLLQATIPTGEPFKHLREFATQ